MVHNHLQQELNNKKLFLRLVEKLIDLIIVTSIFKKICDLLKIPFLKKIMIILLINFHFLS